MKFKLKLANSGSPLSVKKSLEKLAKDLAVKYTPQGGYKYLDAQTSQKTYEKIFAAKIEYITKTTRDFKKQIKEYREWEHITPPKVPPDLKKEVKSVDLYRKYI